MLTAEARKPAVPMIVGGARFPRQHELVGKLLVHPSASTFAQRQLQEVLQLVTGLWGKALLQRQRIASEPLALGGLHLSYNPQRIVQSLGIQSMVNTHHINLEHL